MEIIYKKGDLLECEESWILHGCNAQGKMGSGVAKLIRDKYPTAHMVYMYQYDNEEMKLGSVTYAQQDDGKTIFNGITQEFYGHQSKHAKRVYVSYKAIEDVMWCIDQQAAASESIGIRVAMPKIGAGLGGGDWDIIAEIIENNSFNFQPVVYEL